MDIPDHLQCLFSTDVTQRDGAYTIEIPKRELALGEIREGTTYRVALLPAVTQNEGSERDKRPSALPVEEGERRTVEIEDIGDQGDGIARVKHGYVVIIPDTEKGERVRIEITDVRENVAFATVKERVSYYE